MLLLVPSGMIRYDVDGLAEEEHFILLPLLVPSDIRYGLGNIAEEKHFIPLPHYYQVIY